MTDVTKDLFEDEKRSFGRDAELLREHVFDVAGVQLACIVYEPEPYDREPGESIHHEIRWAIRPYGDESRGGGAGGILKSWFEDPDPEAAALLAEKRAAEREEWARKWEVLVLISEGGGETLVGFDRTELEVIA